MTELIHEHATALTELCRRHRVRTLEIFGSGAAGPFDPDRSDLDFLVDFMPMEASQHAKSYFGLLAGLEDLFRREIDLVEIGAVCNPYFAKSVNQSRTVLYAA